MAFNNPGSGFGRSITPGSTSAGPSLFGMATPFGSSNGQTSDSSSRGGNTLFGHTAHVRSFYPTVGDLHCGSLVASYSATHDIDGNYGSSQNIVSISAMPVYKGKSHEELRSEDYELNIKGSQRSTTLGGIGCKFVKQVRGSRVASYIATRDSNIPDDKLQSISAMVVYKNKSHEELRSEDYEASDKGTPVGSFGTEVNSSRTPSFSYPPPANSLFGSSNTNTFASSSQAFAPFNTTVSPYSNPSSVAFQSQGTPSTTITTTSSSPFSLWTNPFNPQSQTVISSDNATSNSPFSSFKLNDASPSTQASLSGNTTSSTISPFSNLFSFPPVIENNTTSTTPTVSSFSKPFSFSPAIGNNTTSTTPTAPPFSSPFFSSTVTTSTTPTAPPFSSPFFSSTVTTSTTPTAPPFSSPFFSSTVTTSTTPTAPRFSSPFFSSTVTTSTTPTVSPFSSPSSFPNTTSTTPTVSSFSSPFFSSTNVFSTQSQASLNSTTTTIPMSAPTANPSCPYPFAFDSHSSAASTSPAFPPATSPFSHPVTLLPTGSQASVTPNSTFSTDPTPVQPVNPLFSPTNLSPPQSQVFDPLHIVTTTSSSSTLSPPIWPTMAATVGPCGPSIPSQPSQASGNLTAATEIGGQNINGQPCIFSRTAVENSANVGTPFAPQSGVGISISQPYAVTSLRSGISAMPVSNPSSPVRTPSLMRIRHNSVSHKRLPALTHDLGISESKVPFFSDKEDKPCFVVSFFPRENPRAWVTNTSSGQEQAPTETSEGRGSKTCGNFCFQINVQSLEANDDTSVQEEFPSDADVSALMPKLPNGDYYTEPSINELEAMERAKPGFCSHVKDFVVGRKDKGSIKFLGETDIRELDLESIIKFNDREVIVYFDDRNKPPVGQGLNRPAEITLLNIKCQCKKTGEVYISGPVVERYSKKLIEKAAEQGAEFVSFDPASGEWKFRVEHF